MASAKTIARIEALIWVLIFIGLVTVSLGLATLSYSAATAWSLCVVGGTMALVGVVLIWVRSRMRVDS